MSTPAGDPAARAARSIPGYAARRAQADALYTRAIRGGMDPARVARTTLRIARARWPRPRYPVGAQARASGAAPRTLPPPAAL